MKFTEYIVLFLLLLMIATSFVCFNKFEDAQQNFNYRIDTVKVPAPYPVTVVKDSIETKIKYVPYPVYDRLNLPDTLKNLVFKRDSIGNEIRKRGATIEMKLDTVLQTNDTISITADEIQRRIQFTIQYSPRTVIVPRPVEVVREYPSWSFGVGVGYGAATDGKLYPTVNLNVSKVIFSF
jgi:hypothetical protein